MIWLLLGIMVLFVLFGMDVRRKKGMTTIVGKRYVVLEAAKFGGECRAYKRCTGEFFPMLRSKGLKKNVTI